MPGNVQPDSRRSERRPATIQIRLVLEAHHFKEDNSAIAIDISNEGVGVRTTLELVPGQWVGYVIKGKFPHAIPSRVIWSREDQYSHWTYAGIEFLPTTI